MKMITPNIIILITVYCLFTITAHNVYATNSNREDTDALNSNGLDFYSNIYHQEAAYL